MTIFDEEKENAETEGLEAATADVAEEEAEAGDTDAGEAHGDGVEEAVDITEPELADVKPVLPSRPTRNKRTPEEKTARRARRKQRRIAARSDKRKPIIRIPKPQQARGARKERMGVVVSDAMDRTITVRVERAFPHPRYGKVIRRSSTFAVHDADNSAAVGDRVRIVETRPLSKTKRWRLAEIVEAAR